MKKAKLYLLAFLSLTVYVLAMNPGFMRFFVEEWNNSYRPAALQWDRYKYGDLYGLSYLRDYKATVGGAYEALEKKPAGEAEINLWLIGDSFLEKAFNTGGGAFNTGNIQVHHFCWYGVDQHAAGFNRVAGKPNILLIEINERFIRSYLHEANAGNYLACYSAGSPPAETGKKIKATARIVPEQIEQNIETILFGYELFAPLKETKAGLHYKLLGRAAEKVYVDEKQQRLFLRTTVDPSGESSSFAPVTEEQVKMYVASMNRIYMEYKNKGFDEVVFAIVPNAATVTPPENKMYNGLIPRIQNDEQLQVPFIDVYTPMTASPRRESLYWKSDTHWNAEGFGTWLQQFGSTMEKLTGKPSGLQSR